MKRETYLSKLFYDSTTLSKSDRRRYGFALEVIVDGTALPPDVRRGYAPPFTCCSLLGLALGAASGPINSEAQPERRA